MIKPQAIALSGYGERSATIPDPAAAVSVVGSTIDTQRLSGALTAISRIASISGAGASIEVVVEDSADGNTFSEVGRFPARGAVTDPPDVLAFDRVARWVRARVEISGDAAVTIRAKLETIGILV